MKWNTFEGWKAMGFGVLRGSKSILREPDTDLALFNEEQVALFDIRAFVDVVVKEYI